MSVPKKKDAGNIQIPSPPSIAVKILDVVQDPECSARDLAKVVSMDPALVARILRAANGSYYGLEEKVGTIQKAVDVLGTRRLTGLALSFALVKGFRRQSIDGFDHDLFWRRAVTAAVAADLVGKKWGIRNDEIFVTALLMDLGVMVMYLDDPPRYLEVLDRKRMSGEPAMKAERAVFGTDHAAVGSRMFLDWGLPPEIGEAVAAHHDPQETADERKSLAGLLRIADRASAFYHGGGVADKLGSLHALFEPEGPKGDTNRNLVPFLNRIAEKSKEIFAVFDLPDGRMRTYSEIVQEARRELENLNLSTDDLAMLYLQEKQRGEGLSRRLRKTNERLRRFSASDELTGLHSPHFFQAVIEKEVDRADRHDRPLSLLLIDIDYFDQINDTYGHPEGDLVLKRLSNMLQRSVRISDTVARWGCDEFALLLPETDLEGAVVVADRIRKNAEGLEIRSSPRTIRFTVSLGVTGTPGTEPSPGREVFFSAAGDALLYSKGSGGNRFSVSRPEGVTGSTQKRPHGENRRTAPPIDM